MLWVSWVWVNPHMKAMQSIKFLSICLWCQASTAACLCHWNVVVAVQGRAWAQQAAHAVYVCTYTRGTNVLHMVFAILTAFARSFKTGMLTSALRSLSSATGVWGQTHLCRGFCKQQALTVLMKVPTDRKERFAFMLLCNLCFIPQRRLHADKNKTLNANVCFCQHP